MNNNNTEGQKRSKTVAIFRERCNNMSPHPLCHPAALYGRFCDWSVEVSMLSTHAFHSKKLLLFGFVLDAFTHLWKLSTIGWMV